jgi:uncharacterized UBP type Zn finger protein
VACGHLVAGISGSNPAEGMVVRLACCVLSATICSLVQRSLTGFVCVIVSDVETSTMRRPTLDFGCYDTKKIPKRSEYPDLSLAWYRRGIELWTETEVTYRLDRPAPRLRLGDMNMGT